MPAILITPPRKGLRRRRNAGLRYAGWRALPFSPIRIESRCRRIGAPARASGRCRCRVLGEPERGGDRCRYWIFQAARRCTSP